MKNFIPFAHATSIYDVDIKFFLDNGIKSIFLDLDNTLDSYKLHKPSERAMSLVSTLKAAGFNLVIISNNKKNRVGEYVDYLGIDYIWSTGKPFPFKINKYVSEHGLNKDEIIIVGDQLMTDTLAGNRAKIKVLLTEKIVKEDQPTTHINRIFDRPIRKYLRKKGLLVDWREKLKEKVC